MASLLCQVTCTRLVLAEASTIPSMCLSRTGLTMMVCLCFSSLLHINMLPGYLFLFKPIISEIINIYRPSAIVLQVRLLLLFQNIDLSDKVCSVWSRFSWLRSAWLLQLEHICAWVCSAPFYRVNVFSLVFHMQFLCRVCQIFWHPSSCAWWRRLHNPERRSVLVR